MGLDSTQLRLYNQNWSGRAKARHRKSLFLLSPSEDWWNQSHSSSQPPLFGGADLSERPRRRSGPPRTLHLAPAGALERAGTRRGPADRAFSALHGAAPWRNLSHVHDPAGAGGPHVVVPAPSARAYRCEYKQVAGGDLRGPVPVRHADSQPYGQDAVHVRWRDDPWRSDEPRLWPGAPRGGATAAGAPGRRRSPRGARGILGTTSRELWLRARRAIVHQPYAAGGRVGGVPAADC